MTRRILSIGLAVLVVGLASCAKPKPPQSPLVQTVAVLPFDNESNDVNAADLMQRLVYLALQNSPYRPVELGVVNQRLKDKGIVDGGQLPALDPVKIGTDLGVQALVYGNVSNFGYTNVGFYLQRKASVELKLVDARTGQTLWENEGTGARREVHVDPREAKAAFVTGLADQAVDKAFRNPLAEEARTAVISALRTLPGYAFAGFAVDKEGPTAGQTVGQNILKGAIRGRSRQ